MQRTLTSSTGITNPVSCIPLKSKGHQVVTFKCHSVCLYYLFIPNKMEENINVDRQGLTQCVGKQDP